MAYLLENLKEKSTDSAKDDDKDNAKEDDEKITEMLKYYGLK